MSFIADTEYDNLLIVGSVQVTNLSTGVVKVKSRGLNTLDGIVVKNICIDGKSELVVTFGTMSITSKKIILILMYGIDTKNDIGYEICTDDLITNSTYTIDLSVVPQHVKKVRLTICGQSCKTNDTFIIKSIVAKNKHDDNINEVITIVPNIGTTQTSNHDVTRLGNNVYIHIDDDDNVKLVYEKLCDFMTTFNIAFVKGNINDIHNDDINMFGIIIAYGTISHDVITKMLYMHRMSILVVANGHSSFMEPKNNLNDMCQFVVDYVNGINMVNDLKTQLDNREHYNEKISVIMTSYNRQKTIINSINSMLNQSYQNLKIVVVDDNSTDKTYELLCGLYKDNERVTLIKNTKNKGTYFCKNLAINYIDSDTKYVAFQDSDDISHIFRIEAQYLMCKHTSSVINCCLGVRNSVLRIPCVTQMYHIDIIRKYLGFFDDSTRFGADNEYFHRVMKYFNILPSGMFYGFEYNKNSVICSNISKYSFVSVSLYTILDDDNNNITKTFPLTSDERKTYCKRYLSKISRFSRDYEYFYCFDTTKYLQCTSNTSLAIVLNMNETIMVRLKTLNNYDVVALNLSDVQRRVLYDCLFSLTNTKWINVTTRITCDNLIKIKKYKCVIELK
jgi:glycosyltransferase involved in cell wall biosynthesis